MQIRPFPTVTTMRIRTLLLAALLLPPVAASAQQSDLDALPLPPAGTGKPVSVSDEALEQALQAVRPMTPEQIRKFRTIMEEQRKAQSLPISPSTPINRSIDVALKPGEISPVLRVQAGKATSLTFSDITGRPWPVLAVTVGNNLAAKAESAGKPGDTNIVVVSPLQQQFESNMIVTLVNNPVPVAFTLRTGDAQVDYRADVRVKLRGPNAAVDAVGGAALAPTSDVALIAFLDGTPPRGAERMRTTSGDVEAWWMEGLLYVRTPNQLLSPIYKAKSSHVSGVNVYQIVDAPVLIVSRDGQMATVRISR